ncbi:glutaredoxin family protein [Clostridium sp. DL1XJH146]
MIKVYSLPTCPHCQKAKRYFDKIEEEYVDINVGEDLEGRQEMFDLSHQKNVPVININGEIIVGFNKTAIDNALNEVKEQ